MRTPLVRIARFQRPVLLFHPNRLLKTEPGQSPSVFPQRRSESSRLAQLSLCSVRLSPCFGFDSAAICLGSCYCSVYLGCCSESVCFGSFGCWCSVSFDLGFFGCCSVSFCFGSGSGSCFGFGSGFGFGFCFGCCPVAFDWLSSG